MTLYDITLIVSDELGEEKPNLHPYDVFFHYFDRALSSYGFYLVKYCFTTNKDTGYFLLSDEMDNLYRLFVRTELEYLRFLYGSIVDPDSNFSISNVNEIEPQDTYNEKIKVFRRDGSAMDIDKGATVLDFAFYVHTDLGLHFDYALVDESKSKLPKNTRLSEGDLITVVSLLISISGRICRPAGGLLFAPAVGSPAAFLCKLSRRPDCIKNEYFLPNMQCFDSVYTSYFSLYSKKLFLKRRCMH